jgi:hypothetical protein
VVGALLLNIYASRETLERAAVMFERDLADYSLFVAHIRATVFSTSHAVTKSGCDSS